MHPKYILLPALALIFSLVIRFFDCGDDSVAVMGGGKYEKGISVTLSDLAFELFEGRELA